MEQSNVADRLWRARRRHDHIDAVLTEQADAWVLEFVRNDRSLLKWTFRDAETARAEADTRLRALQQAGWNTHW